MHTIPKDKIVQRDVLYSGELRIRECREHCIMIVGRTRTGKTCLFNHILNKPMIGKEQDGLIEYVPFKSDGSYAEMGSSAACVTLVPNVADISPWISLVDIAGFG